MRRGTFWEAGRRRTKPVYVYIYIYSRMLGGWEEEEEEEEEERTKPATKCERARANGQFCMKQ